MALIRLSNIEKSFQDGEDRENNVLRGINMEVEKGEYRDQRTFRFRKNHFIVDLRNDTPAG